MGQPQELNTLSSFGEPKTFPLLLLTMLQNKTDDMETDVIYCIYSDSQAQ